MFTEAMTTTNGTAVVYPWASPLLRIFRSNIFSPVLGQIHANYHMDLVTFCLIPIKSDQTIVQLAVLCRLVLSWLHPFALHNNGWSETEHKKWCKFGVLSLIYFRGHFDEIGIAKFLLGLKPHHAENVLKCRLTDAKEGALRNNLGKT